MTIPEHCLNTIMEMSSEFLKMQYMLHSSRFNST